MKLQRHSNGIDVPSKGLGHFIAAVSFLLPMSAQKKVEQIGSGPLAWRKEVKPNPKIPQNRILWSRLPVDIKGTRNPKMNK